MATLHEKINADMILAMKEKKRDVVDFLRVIKGEFGRVGKDLTDEQALPILKKMSQNAKDMGNDYEVDILNVYLPQMLGEDQIRLIIADIIVKNGFSGMKDMGNVMKEIKQLPEASQIDGKLASTIVKEILLQ